MSDVMAGAGAGKNMGPEKIKKKLTKKQKKTRLYIVLGVVGALMGVIWLGFQPLTGSIQYGVCRTFLELHVKYPKTIKVTSHEVFDKSLRVFYTYIDTFGSHRSEMLECDYRPFNLLNLEAVRRNRKPVNKEIVENFNKTIPAVVYYKPDLVIPFPPGDSLMELQHTY